jgi:phenylalanyl-tRNA synthetase beta chain
MGFLPSKTSARFAPASATDRAYDHAMALRRACAAQGLHEARSLALVPAEPLGAKYTLVSSDALRRVKNPMIDDQVVLRPNLLHGLLKAVGDNVRAGAKSIRLFEIGRVYSAQAPEESAHAAIVLSGAIAPPSWRSAETRDADLYHLKGVLTAALGHGTTFEPVENASLALSLAVQVHGEAVGFAGQLWPADARALDAQAPVLFAEIDLSAIQRAAQSSAGGKYREIPRFPSATRDIAMLAPVQLVHAQVERALRGANEPLLAKVELFDLFTDPTGAKVPADKKSLAYSLTYRSADRTLTADEVSAAHGRLKERLKAELGVTFRE